jgi:hypothetical protein
MIILKVALGSAYSNQRTLPSSQQSSTAGSYKPSKGGPRLTTIVTKGLQQLETTDSAMESDLEKGYQQPFQFVQLTPLRLAS